MNNTYNTEPDIELSVVMPCLNEAKTVGICIKKAIGFFELYNINGEVIIADNGSTDGSQDIAVSEGARVVNVQEKGYGNALKGGFAAAKGCYIIMGDADDSYDFSALEGFVARLREGYALVMGNRFKGGVMPGAMPFLHRYLGNPVLSFLGRLFFRTPIGDFHCGLRGFTKEAYESLHLSSGGMELASEIVFKAALLKLPISEIPVVLYPDGRERKPHLNTWRDGWRHLKLLLIYCPRWLFLYPGLLLLFTGLILGIRLTIGELHIAGINLDIHTLFYSGIFSVTGVILCMFYIFARLLNNRNGLFPFSKPLDRLVLWFAADNGIWIGILLFLLGITGTIFSVSIWDSNNFGDLDPVKMFRYVIPSGFVMINGLLFFFSAFFVRIIYNHRDGNS